MNLKFKRVLHLVPAMYTYSTCKHTNIYFWQTSTGILTSERTFQQWSLVNQYFNGWSCLLWIWQIAKTSVMVNVQTSSLTLEWLNLKGWYQRRWRVGPLSVLLRQETETWTTCLSVFSVAEIADSCWAHNISHVASKPLNLITSTDSYVAPPWTFTWG